MSSETTEQASDGQPGSPIICDIHTTADPDPAGCFRLVWHERAGASEEGSELRLRRRSGFHDLCFVIHDEAQRGIQFLRDPDESFVTVPGPAREQIQGGSVSIDRRRLTIRDRNVHRPCTIRARLRFDPEPYEAEVLIHNGGSAGLDSSWAGVIVALTAVIGAAILILLR